MIPKLSRLTSLGEVLRDSTATFKGNVALIEADRHREVRRLSYLDLRREAEEFAARVQGLGFAPGDRLAILMSNQSRWVIGGMGALWAGAVLVPLDYKLTASEQLALLRHARPRVLLTEFPIFSDLKAEDAGVLSDMHVVVSEPPRGADLGGAIAFDAPVAGEFNYVGRQREDLASIVYSSGTGGLPKGCMLAHDNYLEQAEVLAELFPMEEDEAYFSVLPTNHAVDFMCGMILPFLYGACVVHQRTLRPEFLASTMKRYRVTHTALVPRILKSLRERIEEQLERLPEWQRTALKALMDVNDLATLKRPSPRLSRMLLAPIHARFGGRLRVIVAGGAFVEPELAEFFNRIGLPICIG
ncbi:MAG: AMP-binding protein, partial [Myxococcales bacterium]|nr:AMP-binding protein [Myxococcales bacterium]